MPLPLQQFLTILGTPLVGGKLYTYSAGTSNPKVTYTDSAGTVPHQNPISLNARGEPPAPIFWSGSYRIELRDALGNLIYSVDNYTDPVSIVDAALAALQLADYPALRAYTGDQTVAYITGVLATAKPSGIAGLFVRDNSTDALADNNGTIIVGHFRWRRVYQGGADLKWFGAVGDGATDNTAAFAAAFAACKSIIISGNDGEIYRTSKYPRANNIDVLGIGRPTINVFYKDTQVMVQFGDHSTHNNILFNSTEANLPWQRASLENVTGAKLINCGFYGFRDTAAAPNAWGLYLASATDCVIDRCDFGNNSQSDIAMTDTNNNITIIHATNATNSGVSVDIEPNGTSPTDGVVVIGGNFRLVSVLENDFTTYASRNIAFMGSRITKLVYDGANASFDDACAIGSIVNQDNMYAYAGDLNLSLELSGNLIDDPYMVDLANPNAAGEWMPDYVSTTWAVDRVRDADGTYIRVNKANQNQAHWLKSKQIPLITGTNPLLYMHIGRSQIPAGAGWIGKRDYVEYFTAGGVSLGISYVITARGLGGTTTPMQPHFAVLLPPAGASYVVLHNCYSGLVSSGGNFSTICDHIVAMGLYEISGLQKSANTRQIASQLMQGASRIVTKASHVPNTATHVGAFAGDRVENKSAAVGATPAWKCVATPNTWAAEAVLTAP
jgi:hypothetical protein